MRLLKSLSGLITEVAALDQVQDSIRKKQVIVIYYDGKDNGGKGYRTIEPVCLGYSKKGNLVLRAWEIEGQSYSKIKKNNPIPGWRLFRLDKIFTYRPTMDNFVDMRPEYNPNGDRTMTRVLLNATFGNEENLA
jgi:predicted DNA-binding transcriptional regulator YafY